MTQLAERVQLDYYPKVKKPKKGLRPQKLPSASTISVSDLDLVILQQKQGKDKAPWRRKALSEFEDLFADSCTLSVLDRTSSDTNPLPIPWHADEPFAGIAALDDDWDGDGAEAPSKAMRESAIDLARQLEQLGSPPPQRIVATVDGGIVYRWRSENQVAEVEFIRPGLVEGMKRRRDGSFAHLRETNDAKAIMDFLFAP